MFLRLSPRAFLTGGTRGDGTRIAEQLQDRGPQLVTGTFGVAVGVLDFMGRSGIAGVTMGFKPRYAGI